MPDLNDLLLFIAIVSPLVVLGRTAKRGAAHREWRGPALVVLLVTAAAWLLVRPIAGLLGGLAWLLLLFIPAFALRKIGNLTARYRFAAAGRLAALLVPLHPSRILREQARLLRGLALAQQGDREVAIAALNQIAAGETRVSRYAEAQRFQIAADWQGLLAWCGRYVPRVGVGEDPALLPLYFRALGELGLRDELVLQFAGRAPMLLASPLHQPVFLTSLVLVLAFCGRTAALTELLRKQARHLPDDVSDYWLATSEAAAGNLGPARMRFERLRKETQDALLRRDASDHLARRGQLPPLPLSAPSEATLARFERGLGETSGGWAASPMRRATPAVVTFIALNVLMFLVEILRGGSTNPATLASLGALEPFIVFFRGQYWRMVAALFLHYGPLHLVFNLYALYVLGPALESWIGSVRFAVAYLLAGIGSSAGVLLLWRIGLTQADLLVGASGSVMGIVGTWAGVLLAHRHAPIARQRLMNIALIVVLQTMFDLYTPQVSMAAHLSGLGSGFLLGLFLRPKRAL